MCQLEKLQAVGFQVYLCKMAAAIGGSHGGKRDNSGRKRKYEGPNSSEKTWNSQYKRVYLSLTIFESCYNWIWFM